MQALHRKHPGLIYKVSFLFAFVAAFTFLALRLPQGSTAVSLADFRPGNIISDYTMGNYTTMSVADIDAFLHAHGNCDDRDTVKASWYPNVHYHIKDGHFVCLADEVFTDGIEYGDLIPAGAKTRTAAQIIYDVAQEWKINPQVLLVLLEKEQGLISDSWPNSIQYRSATGFGCPDTAPCNAVYYGFYNQLDNAAYLFRTVLDGGWTNYPLGDNYIAYSPNAACGGSIVNIENLATSSLYRYTPYQPNAAALAAGYGTVTCGAYGNRNFFLFFTNWFGDPTITVEQPKEFADHIGQTIPNGTYVITSTFGTAVDIDRAATADFSKVWMYSKNNTPAQIFELTYNSAEDYYTFTNPNSGKVLDVPEHSTSNGALIKINTKNDSCSQKWKIIDDQKGNYEVISVCSGKALDIDQANPNLGAKLQIYEHNSTPAQKWQFDPVLAETTPQVPETPEPKQPEITGVIPNGTYVITSTFGTAVDIDRAATADFSKVWMYSKNNTPAQIFELTYNSAEDYYTFTNPNSGKVLDVPEHSTSNGALIKINTKNDSCSQKWKIIDDQKGNYEVISVCSGKALDIDQANPNLGAKLQIYEHNSTPAQKWQFVKIEN